MIPQINNINIEIMEEPTYTYGLDFYNDSLKNNVNNLEAMEQAIYKIIFTTKGEHIIYSDQYGINLNDLFGMPRSYVCVEIERRIKEALLRDNRITDVFNFNFDLSKKSVVFVSFETSTVFGNIKFEGEVMN